MSDSAQVLVATVDDGVVRDRGAAILAWLVEQGIVEAAADDSGLSGPGHRPGRRVQQAVEELGADYYDFRKMRTNGMELSVHGAPRLQSAGDELPTFKCPGCRVEVDGEPLLEWAFGDWADGTPTPRVRCAGCAKESAATELVVEGGAFGNLMLRFWNWWPLTKGFVAGLEKRFDVKFVLVWDRI